VIIFKPVGKLAAAAGVTVGEDRPQPLRLRVSGFLASGLAGESLPVVGGGQWLEGMKFDDTRSVAELYDPMRIDGMAAECPGIIDVKFGNGRVIAVAFDLAKSVMLLRQGDPVNTERRLYDGPGHAQTPKPSDLATDIGPRDCGWLPFADLEARLLVDLIDLVTPSPLPLVSHLPGAVASIVLYSGDEDVAKLEATKEEFDMLTEKDARMSLYIIPEETHSTRADGEAYRKHHDIAPHPNLVGHRSAPISERVAEYERQIRVFNEKFGMTARTVSNHVATWAGYLDLVYVQQRLGIRMDLNFFSAHFQREREHAPYSPFGSAMPMRFCEPTGGLIDVYQQHRHLHDDILFSRGRGYSYGFTLPVFTRWFRRMLRDSIDRFHMPLTCNFHPGNWVDFSREFGMQVVEDANDAGVPVWSFEQWLDLLEATEACTLSSSWDGRTLMVDVSTGIMREDLRLWLPGRFENLSLNEIRVDGRAVDWMRTERFGKAVAIVPARTGRVEARFA